MNSLWRYLQVHLPIYRVGPTQIKSSYFLFISYFLGIGRLILESFQLHCNLRAINVREFANWHPKELVRIQMKVTSTFGEFAKSKINKWKGKSFCDGQVKNRVKIYIHWISTDSQSQWITSETEEPLPWLGNWTPLPASCNFLWEKFINKDPAEQLHSHVFDLSLEYHYVSYVHATQHF